MDLIRDLLDTKVVDRNGREMGRVDSVVLEVREGTAPRVVALELGPEVLAGRLHPMFGRWVEGLEHAFGVAEGRPVRIVPAQVLTMHDHVKVDLAVGETAGALIEHHLRRWLASIPGSS
jgi:hypothetical protein